MVKLKASLSFEYNAPPLHYSNPNPQAMANEDLHNFLDIPSSLLEIAQAQNTQNFIIEVVPLDENNKPQTVSLLIYTGSGTGADLFLIPDELLTDQDRKVLETVHGTFYNDENSNWQEVDRELTLIGDACLEENCKGEETEWEHKFTPFKIHQATNLTGKHISRIYHTGFKG